MTAEQQMTQKAPSSLTQLWQEYKIPLIVIYYGVCSSTLIVINKVAVHNLKAPVFILVLQLLFATFTVKGLNLSGFLEAEKLQWTLVRPFLLIVAGFLGEEAAVGERQPTVGVQLCTNCVPVEDRAKAAVSNVQQGQTCRSQLAARCVQHRQAYCCKSSSSPSSRARLSLFLSTSSQCPLWRIRKPTLLAQRLTASVPLPASC